VGGGGYRSVLPSFGRPTVQVPGKKVDAVRRPLAGRKDREKKGKFGVLSRCSRRAERYEKGVDVLPSGQLKGTGAVHRARLDVEQAPRGRERRNELPRASHLQSEHFQKIPHGIGPSARPTGGGKGVCRVDSGASRSTEKGVMGKAVLVS